MILDIEKNSNDFSGPSIKLSAENECDAFRLGEIAESIRHSGCEFTFSNDGEHMTFVRVAMLVHPEVPKT